MYGFRKLTLSELLCRAAVAGGWLLYLYEMIRIIHRTLRNEEKTFIFLLLLAVLLINISVVAWIRHKKQVAAHGEHGLRHPHLTPPFGRDHLGRQLFFAEHFLLSPEIVISVLGNSKFYAIAAEVPAEDAAA
jgi:ABC-type dipeptide/oligopeptide/nickel transport system permease subunit